MRPLYVLACSQTKDPELVDGYQMQARDAYTGQAFRMARAQLEAAGAQWCILSGWYGFLWPTTWIETYDVRMEPVDEDTDFECFEAITQRQYGKLRSAGQVVVIGSRLYADACRHLLRRDVLAPVAGLPIGRMLQAIKKGDWLKITNS